MIMTSSKNPRIELITGPERRMRWAQAESHMVNETFEHGMTASSVHGLPRNCLFGVVGLWALLDW
jgi:hypothetical protein